MDRFRCFVILLSTMLTLSALSGCSTVPPPSAADSVSQSDRDLAALVYDRLARDTMVRGHTIGVRAVDGAVVLSGLPMDSEKRARAIAIVEGTSGVRSVNY